MSLLNLYTFFYEIQKDVLKTIYWSYLFSCNESEKGLKKGLICLSLSVSIQTCQFVTDAVTLSRIHVHCVEKSNLHSLRFLLLYSTQERTSSGLGTTRCYFWYRWTCLCPKRSGPVACQWEYPCWVDAPQTHGRSQWANNCDCCPLHPTGMPISHGARSDALYSHPAQTRRHAEPFLEARRDRLASLLFPQGVAFFPTTVEWNKAVGDEWEQPTQLLGGKGRGVFFSTVCCHGWRAAFQSLLASSAMTHHVACWSNDVSFSLLFSPFLSNLRWSTIPQSLHVPTALCTNSSKTNGGCR